MAWTFSGSTLRSSSATEAAPDSLLEGLALVQAADATRGYRNGFVAWAANLLILVDNDSHIIIDDDAMIELRGSAYINPQSGGVIHGNRSKLILSTTSERIDAAIDFQSGSKFICRRQNPQDPSPQIIYRATRRHDYPDMLSSSVPAKVDIQGLDLYGVVVPSGSGNNHFCGMYYGRATEASVKNIRIFGVGVAPQFKDTTYDDFYSETLRLPSDTAINICIFNRPTYYSATQSPFGGEIRGAQITLTNPTFLNNCWSQSVDLLAPVAASVLAIQYTYSASFLAGLTPLQGVNIRFTRARESVIGAPTWTAPGDLATATTDAAGTFASVNLLDAYRSGLSLTDFERFNWTAKARKYERRTAAETIFDARVLYRHSVNMSAGYSEEVQMLTVQNLTLTQAEAEALTGIAFSASGATGGTVTVTENHTAGEIWAAYRVWISQLANFDSEDSWLFVAGVLDIGAWNMTIDGAVVTGSLTTTGTVTLQNGASVTGGYIDANGNSFLRFDGIDSWTVYSDANRTSQLGTGTATGIFRFNYVPATTYYMTVISAGTTFLIENTPTEAGETVVSLATAALLLALNAKVEAIPTTPLLAADYTAPDNAGITAIKGNTGLIPYLLVK